MAKPFVVVEIRSITTIAAGLRRRRGAREYGRQFQYSCGLDAGLARLEPGR